MLSFLGDWNVYRSGSVIGTGEIAVQLDLWGQRLGRDHISDGPDLIVGGSFACLLRAGTPCDPNGSHGGAALRVRIKQ